MRASDIFYYVNYFLLFVVDGRRKGRWFGWLSLQVGVVVDEGALDV